MPDLYVTLVSVQPVNAVLSAARTRQQSRPQSDGNLGAAGTFTAKRKKQIVRGKKR